MFSHRLSMEVSQVPSPLSIALDTRDTRDSAVDPKTGVLVQFESATTLVSASIAAQVQTSP
ncbi:hypothetical protein SBA6_390011 [Candidatus Sulfopaludibacter sp. SbA6]|nr:hypothetical protein SBA6_390011 [Candidatus Sulfopaludibacter sp. SbA6]